MQFEGVLIKTNSQEVGQAHMHVQSTSRSITQTFRGNRVIQISKQKTGKKLLQNFQNHFSCSSRNGFDLCQQYRK